MDWVKPVVSVKLLDVVLARVAVSAVYLDRQVVGGQAPLRGPAFGDRSEELEQEFGFPSLVEIGGARLIIDQPRAVEVQRKPSFNIAFLRQKHAPHIGMTHEGDLWLGRVLCAGRAALASASSVVESVQIARITGRGRVDAHHDPRLVHHGEHRSQAAVKFPD